MAQIALAAEEVEQFAGGGIESHGVDGEVAARGGLLGCNRWVKRGEEIAMMTAGFAVAPGNREVVGAAAGSKFDDAKAFYRKALEIDPNDPEPYYSIGVIDWTQSYQPRMEERAKIGLKPEEPLKDKKVCAALKAKAWDPINDGLEQLNKALQIRPDYDDAMAYMNLLYREKADVECDDLPTRTADLKTADDWVNKTMATKKAKAEKQPASNGVSMEQPKQ